MMKLWLFSGIVLCSIEVDKWMFWFSRLWVSVNQVSFMLLRCWVQDRLVFSWVQDGVLQVLKEVRWFCFCVCKIFMLLVQGLVLQFSLMLQWVDGCRGRFLRLLSVLCEVLVKIWLEMFLLFQLQVILVFMLWMVVLFCDQKCWVNLLLGLVVLVLFIWLLVWLQMQLLILLWNILFFQCISFLVFCRFNLMLCEVFFFSWLLLMLQVEVDLCGLLEYSFFIVGVCCVKEQVSFRL